eukprot:TRINITY_DN13315_c0_g1_i1.p2 TRINITY_DN13315_c0_g1~~TRINITY_DN13315_c0_g1_i1.p2  ORF type:complete len:100 (-),score=17.12 TRINITY_DN13315_c0_g1_i1:1213-1512(-)
MACPMRIFLVMFSVIVAAYLAWRNSGQEQKVVDIKVSLVKEERRIVETKSPCKRAVDGAWKGLCLFVDFASGRYLWQRLVSASGDSTDGVKNGLDKKAN